MNAASKPGRDFFAAPVLVVALALLVPLIVFLANPYQPLLEHHAFRQTQTALTAYWLQHGGPILSYITPVLGYPWSVPFEFPLYQLIVEGVSTLTGLPLDVSGRLLSLIFFYATCLPMFLCLRRYGTASMAIAVASFVTGPIGLFFSRAFLIETLATLLAFSSLCCYVAYRRRAHVIYLALFAALGTLAGLQKITTFSPVFLVCMADCLYLRVVHFAAKSGRIRPLVDALFVASSLVVPYLWTRHTDIVKSTGFISSYLTSTDLASFVFGGLSLRLHAEYWVRVYLARIVLLGGFSVPIILMILAAKRDGARLNAEALLFLAAGLLGPLIFANLHNVHDYYQVGSLAFLAAGFGIALAKPHAEMRAISQYRLALIVGAVVVVNIMLFGLRYWPKLNNLGQREATALSISRYIRARTRPDDAVLIVGMDMSSEVPYYSERFALMIPSSILSPQWPAARSEVMKAPEKFIGMKRLGSLVYCNYSSDTSEEERDRLSDSMSGETRLFDGCLVKIRSQ